MSLSNNYTSSQYINYIWPAGPKKNRARVLASSKILETSTRARLIIY